MIAFLICLLGFVSVYIAGRRSLSAGVGLALSFGYMYGLIRGNVPQPAAYFVFDASLAGLYLAILTRKRTPVERRKMRQIAPWVLIMTAWPIALALLPLQDSLIQLVGLRGQVFFLPCLLIGAMLDDRELRKLAFWLAALNIVAFAFGAGEYIWGIARFLPRNASTAIIYISKDVATSSGDFAYRIPSTFVNPAGYGGVMVLTMPLLVGAWARKGEFTWNRVLFAVSIGAAVLGVFMCASRSQAVLMIVLAIVVSLSFRVRLTAYLAWAVIAVAVGWMVVTSPRLQRFTSLQDTSYVQVRLRGSVNQGFLEQAENYPLGNGLGGGGTSIPYFLQDRLANRLVIENEYARIMAELGIPGLAMWIAFIFWVFTRAAPRRSDPWFIGRRLAYVATLMFLAMGVIGLGLLTWVPGTAMLMLLIGWVAVPNRLRVAVADPWAPAIIRSDFIRSRVGT
ncbi:O-antigen ligase family protein [Candidatus Binatus sp.]|uniref:O-antigen ligase family protein n=1 Tax=Candidatus Binatus sp. TaxID=2811406 RepID=UPI003C364168